MYNAPNAIIDKIHRIKNERPDLIEKILNGDLTIDAAIGIIKEATETEVIPINDFIVVADILAKGYKQRNVTKDEIDRLFYLLDSKLEPLDEWEV